MDKLSGPIGERGSYVVECKRPAKCGPNPCVVDWHDPEEYDEVDSEATQCAVFVCETCGQHVLASTWKRQP